LRATTAITEPRVAKAFSHPLRAKILFILEDRAASPREIADELGVPIGNVSYHVRTLLSLKLIRLVRTTPRRGSIEHHYEAVDATRHISDATWGQTPGIAKSAILDSVLNEIGTDVGRAARTGGFDRDDAHLTRTNVVLDSQAWLELAGELKRILARAKELEQESRARLTEAEHAGERPTGLVMMLYQKLPAIDPVPELPAEGEPEHSVPNRQVEA